MDCEEVRELLDAYALGTVEKEEGDLLERHVADCVRCWEELNKAQRAAALLALSIPLKEPPERLGRRIIHEAREKPAAGPAPAILRRFRAGWSAAIGTIGVAGVAALAFAVFLQLQMNDLRGEKGDLAQRVDTAGQQIDEQRQILAVMSAADIQQVTMTSSEPNTWGLYRWSAASGQGFIVCHNLPALAEGEVYQAWFTTEERPVSAGTFSPFNGSCHFPVDAAALTSPPKGVGVSREQAGGSERPSDRWLLFASFEE